MHCDWTHSRFMLCSVRTDSLRFYCGFSQRTGIRLVLVAGSVSSPGELGLFLRLLEVRLVAVLGGGFDVAAAGTGDGNTLSAQLEGVKTYVIVHLRNTRAALPSRRRCPFSRPPLCGSNRTEHQEAFKKCDSFRILERALRTKPRLTFHR